MNALQQTAKFSALALLRSPLATRKMAFTGTAPDPRSSYLLMLGDWCTVTEPGNKSPCGCDETMVIC
jgi:hypothetical protein